MNRGSQRNREDKVQREWEQGREKKGKNREKKKKE